jgi:protein-disulfide isomerase/uncharacterized membrane protein
MPSRSKPISRKPAPRSSSPPSGKRSENAPRGASAAPPAAVTVPAGLFWTGSILVAVAAIASALLAAGSLPSFTLPGCGLESDCAAVARSAWGKIPGVGWPTSFVGLAWFLALLAAWIADRRRGVAPALRWATRAGAVGSLVLLGAMIAMGHPCPYCIVVHAANLPFVVILEIAARRAAPGVASRALVPFAATFAAASLLLGAALWASSSTAERRAAEERAGSIDAIAGGGSDTVELLARFDGPFTGRYRLGPESAPIRIVTISDYQCPDCRAKEAEIRRVFAARSDVSLSMKHFPFCTDCNRKVRESGRNLHPNACWAARAAETAGMLGGNDGFWRMHFWLFDNGGSFTDATFPASLESLGFDPTSFLSTMKSKAPLALVEADIEEAITLGLRQTPMIFINGVELRGWRTANAVVKAVDELAMKNLPPGTAADDHPPLALAKYVGDWLAQPKLTLPPDEVDWTRGPESAEARVVIWGDYQEPYTAELDARVRAFMAKHPDDVRYSFRHYPFDKSCNASLQVETRHPRACRAAQAAEAAGRLGGVDAYWRMHEWLFANRTRFDDARLLAAAGEMGLDPDALVREMASTDVASAIARDCAASRPTGLTGIPHFFVNDRNVPFWNLEKAPLVERILQEAIAGGDGP